MKHLLLFIAAFYIQVSLHSQNTVGLISLNDSKVYEGYTLIYPHNQPNVYLLNNCGEIVHVWEDDEDFRPGNTAYLREDGTLVKTKRPSSIAGNTIWAGGGGAIIEIRDWNNNLLWSYEQNDENARFHHDIAPMPNGNILATVWEYLSKEDAIAMGRDSNKIASDAIWPDAIIELDPTTSEIVWEWHVTDHLIQDFDSTKANYGVVADNPRRVDFNYDTNEGRGSWMHMNAIDYNPELDQILVSIPYFNEVWILDHSTTTAQAATDKGGLTNHGGNLIYRTGNPAAYQRGTAEDQILFFQHDAHWVDDFIPNGFPFQGQIAVFNNRVGTNFSTAEIFSTPWNMYITDYEQFDGTWPPYEFENTIYHPDTTRIYSTGLSSVQLLANGNRLITSGRMGYTVELTEDNKIAWEYITPLQRGVALSQGDTTLAISENLTFRSYKYPVDYSAFEGKDLTAKGHIEADPDLSYCDRLVPTIDISFDSKIYPNPATSTVQLGWESGGMINIDVFDITGRKRISTTGNGGMKFLDISDLERGLYLILFDGKEAGKLIVE